VEVPYANATLDGTLPDIGNYGTLPDIKKNLSHASFFTTSRAKELYAPKHENSIQLQQMKLKKKKLLPHLIN
jgi:hypothetical protein